MSSRWDAFSDFELLVLEKALPRDLLSRTDVGLALYKQVLEECERRARESLKKPE